MMYVMYIYFIQIIILEFEIVGTYEELQYANDILVKIVRILVTILSGVNIVYFFW
jgi:hypothetical protein